MLNPSPCLPPLCASSGRAATSICQPSPAQPGTLACSSMINGSKGKTNPLISAVLLLQSVLLPRFPFPIRTMER